MADHSDRHSFNPPSVMAARLAAALTAFIGLGSLLMLVGGLVSGEPAAVVSGAAGGGITAILVAWLRRTGRTAEIVSPWRTFEWAEPAGDELERLIEARDAMEAKRGTSGFDVWELLRLRREVQERLDKNPSL